MNNTFLYNEHICLRAVEPEDADVMYLVENDVELWEVGSVNVPYSRYALKQYIANSKNDLFADCQLRLMITRRGEEGAAVGIIDLFDFEPLHGRAAMGIVVLNGYRKKGYARQAIELLNGYCFSHLHLKQLYAHVPCDNVASIKLFTSCGFTQSGVMREWIKCKAGYKDVCLLQKINGTSAL